MDTFRWLSRFPFEFTKYVESKRRPIGAFTIEKFCVNFKNRELPRDEAVPGYRANSDTTASTDIQRFINEDDFKAVTGRPGSFNLSGAFEVLKSNRNLTLKKMWTHNNSDLSANIFLPVNHLNFVVFCISKVTTGTHSIDFVSFLINRFDRTEIQHFNERFLRWRHRRCSQSSNSSECFTHPLDLCWRLFCNYFEMKIDAQSTII